MFMGKVQLVEFGLKNLLTSKYGYDEERVKRWTLGGVVTELRRCELRPDFVHLLEELREYRNYIAHEILVDDALMRRIAGAGAQRFVWKPLRHGLYLVEQTIVVHDFLFGD